MLVEKSKLLIHWIVFDLNKTESGAWVSSLRSNFYRVLGPSKALLRAGHTVRWIDFQVWQMGNDAVLPDMVVLGKLPCGNDEESFAQLRESAMALVHRTQARNIPVVADFNHDHFGTPRYGQWLEELAQNVDLCVTSSEALAARISALTNKPVALIGSPISVTSGPPRVFRQGGSLARFASLLSRRGPKPLELIWFDCAQTWPSMKDWLEAIAPLRLKQRFRVTLVSTGTEEVIAVAEDFNRRFSPDAIATVIEIDNESNKWETLARAEVLLVPASTSGSICPELKYLLANAIHAGCHVVADFSGDYSTLAPYAELTQDPLDALSSYLSEPSAALSKLSQGQSQVLLECAPQSIALAWTDAYKMLQEKRNSAPIRIMFFVSELNNPTFELRYAIPLRQLWHRGEIAWTAVSEHALRNSQIKTWELPDGQEHVQKLFGWFKPTMVVFCRYAGPFVPLALEMAKDAGIPTLLHLDDDLLNLPKEFGPAKLRYHNDPRRREALVQLVTQTDLVVTANTRLVNRLVSYGFNREYFALPIAAAGPPLRLPSLKPTVKIGYMGGSDHAIDLPLALPALIEVLKEFPHVQFELIGDFKKPDGLDQFGARVQTFPSASGCEAFLRFLARRDWDIGLCVLAKLPFNLMKTNLKWIDYARIGAVTIASRGTVFDECCADGAGLLVDGDAEWLEAMRTLILQPEKRLEIALRNQARLREHYGMSVLTEATLATFARAAQLHRKKCGAGGPRKVFQASE